MNSEMLENTVNRDFLIKTGHEIVNILTPFEHLEYLDDDAVAARVARGIRLGKQLGILGRIVNYAENTDDPYSFNEFICNINARCRRLGLNAAIENRNYLSIDSIKNRYLVDTAIDEIIMNWKTHGNGEFILSIVSEKEIVFRNDYTETPFIKQNAGTLKDFLAQPFVKRKTGPGAGLGLFIVETASLKGDFNWTLSADEKYFSLSLFF